MRFRTLLFLLGTILCVVAPRLSAQQIGLHSDFHSFCPHGYTLREIHTRYFCEGHGGMIPARSPMTVRTPTAQCVDGTPGATGADACTGHGRVKTNSKHEGATAKCADGVSTHATDVIAGCARHGGVAHKTAKP